MNVRERYVWSALFCIYIVLVAYVCFAQPGNIPELRPYLWGIPTDKLMHFIMFLPYPIVAYGLFRPEEGGYKRSIATLLTIYAAGILLATGTELLQKFSEYRTCEAEDFYADMAGMSSSALVILFYILFKKNKK